MEQETIRPNPDPSVLTTQYLLREIGNLRDIIETRLKCGEELVEHQGRIIDGRQEVIDKSVNALKDLQDERFRGVDQRFVGLGTQTDKVAELNQKAIDAALQAAKEAVDKQNISSALAISKSEYTTIKSIDQLGLLLQASTKTTDDKINDLKERTTLLEGRKQGAGEGWGFIVGLIGAIASVVAIVVAAFALLGK